MKRSNTIASFGRVAVVIACAGVLAFCALGCETSSTTTTTTTVDNGKSTTTTTTTTTTENGKTTETRETTETTNGSFSSESDPASVDFYELKQVGLRYDLPEGFRFDDINLDMDLSEGKARAYHAMNADEDNTNLTLMEVDDSIDPESEKFLEDRLAEATEYLKSNNMEIVSSDTSTVTLTSGQSLPAIIYQYKNSGDDECSAQAYAVRDGVLFVFTATASDESEVGTIFNGITLS